MVFLFLEIRKYKKTTKKIVVFFYLKIFTFFTFLHQFNLNYERKQNLIIIIIINEKKEKSKNFF